MIPLNRHASDIHVTALVKGEERYVFIYNAATRQQAIRKLGEWASHEDLSFNWYDAAVLSSRIRQGAT